MSGGTRLSGDWRGFLAVFALTAFACVAPAATAGDASSAQDLSGTLKDGALWRARVPTPWNGVLILYSHGYLPDVRPPALAPGGLEPWLLQHGYALAASSYAQGGWAVADAVPDQLATLGIFASKVGKPRRTLAWGESMGGLVTLALAEQRAPRIDAALTACGSIAGSLGMMNMALDGAFAFTTLIAPDAGIRTVAPEDDRSNAARVATALAAALISSQGRARVALAAALAGLPTWTEGDDETQLDVAAKSFVAGVFLPRAEQERVAGGVFSWNSGVDYREQFRRTGRRAWVSRFYERAGIDLDGDLKALNAALRVKADPAAVEYMRAHYVPSGAPQVPVMSYHTLGDGLTSPLLLGAYARDVEHNGRRASFQAAWVRAVGHCRFTAGEHVAALLALEHRLKSGRWDAAARRLNSMVAEAGLGVGRFVQEPRAVQDADGVLRPALQ